MVWELTSSGAILGKAGANVSLKTFVGFTSGARLEQAYLQAEGFINSETELDWTTNLASIGTKFSGAVADVVSSKAAVDMINFDMSGYTSRAEAITMINVNLDIVRKGIAFLKDGNSKSKMGVQ